ncbi:MAG: carbohydrate ABC transporter permease [Lachnospiraceae bacterium]|nr:carbohydrate ABC transporter permease [Lachnospiraceae bacterium]
MAKKVKEKKLQKRGKHLGRSSGGNAAIWVVLLVAAAFMLLPMVYAVSNAFKPLDELFVFPPKFFVSKPTLDNFTDLFTIMRQSWVPFTRYLFNTILITAVGSVGCILVTSMGAFMIAKGTFPGRNLIFKIVVTALMFTGYVTSIPNYLVMSKLGWIDTYWAIIIPAMGMPMGLFLSKQYMEGIPDSILDAAKIDGASLWHTFWHIVMPLSKPAWITVLIFSVQNLWNMRASNFIYSEDLKTLPYALQQILQGGVARTGVGSAVTVIMMVVPIAVFILAQNNVMETMASSGIKD